MKDSGRFPKKLMRYLGSKRQRTLHITGASCLGNAFLSLGKLGIGIYSFNFYIFANGLYTLGMVLARLCVLLGFLKVKQPINQYHCCRLAGMILIAASAAYITYSVRLLLYPQSTRYNEIVGITIATITFFELGLNIRGVLIERKSSTPFFYALKMINLSSAIISLALTQAALLSFQEIGTEYSVWNGLVGILTGGIAISLGIITSRKMKQKEELFNDPYISCR